jgi:DNA-binding GntR family transcriptional regulator
MHAAAKLERPRPLRDQIHERLRGAILSGELAPGTPVIEAEVAASLGASRTPVREALRRLESEGLLEPRGLRGSVVREIKRDEVVCIYEIREALESLAARRASRSMQKRDFAELDRIVEKMRGALDDVLAFERLDTEFHDHILAHADGVRLNRMLGDLRADIVTWRLLSIAGHERRASTVAEHAEMVDAMRARDEAAVAAATSRHIANARESVLERLRETPETGSGDAPTRA